MNKNKPTIRFKEFSDAWEQREFGELYVRSSEKNDGTIDIDKNITVATMQFKPDIKVTTKEYLKTYFTFNVGDIAFEGHQSKEFKFGRFVENDIGNGIVSHIFAVFRPIKEYDLQFWKYAINNESLMQSILSRSTKASTMMHDLVTTDFLREKFAVPSLEEQRKIGSFLNGLDNLITLHQCKENKQKNIKKHINFLNKQIGVKQVTFKYESEFEEALIKVLTNKGWESEIIKYPTEEDLIANWANILFENNRDIDRLNDYPLTSGEMQQILEQVKSLRTPLKLNGFINGKSVTITRDNQEDTLHFGKEVALKIYDRKEIAAGQSRYQIAQQPKYKAKSKILNDRRGDLVLLINGMPLIHIELKRSGVPVSEAYRQIEKYAHEGIFTNLFSLVQIFVAMTPTETRYFANPGPDGVFNTDYYFNWANFNNDPINDWNLIASSLLSIPMAHQLIGFYTVPDDTDGILKVMRSYQYYAASAISDKVSKTKWNEGNQRGGYIWHTTGSGKTMTSFKSAQLISNSKDADKVVFLTDRIELGTQSYKEYSNFAEDNEEVQATENTYVLITKLKSPDAIDTLIVTSIQKMSNIKDDENGLNSRDVENINKKRLVFIIDEAHRSTFGEMLLTIKETFPNAIFFGFTGTPILEENSKKMNDTSIVFGNELHRYSIADGIRDKNVLGFDPYKVLTFRDKDVRREVALLKAKADTVDAALSDPKKADIFNEYMNNIPMAGYKNEEGKYIKGIEDYIPNSQYTTDEHKNAVVKDILESFPTLSKHGKIRFHAIFATSSIPEAISYYRLLKKECPELKTTCLFDPNIDNKEGFEYKEDGLIEILEDYNKRYEQQFTMATHASFKKDISWRLAHKEVYKGIEKTPEKELDLLIVVDQMLTGYDSKWVNTLYMDKMLEYENIIQAFSRTNRLFGHEKQFGTIKYYRRPHTMERNVNEAVKLYSGDKPLGLFVEKLPYNLQKLNHIYFDIVELFKNAGISDMQKLPESHAEKGKFAELFKEFNTYLEAAKIQGFRWDKNEYQFTDEATGEVQTITVDFNEDTYLILAQRYKELHSHPPVPPTTPDDDIPFDIVGYLVEIDTGKIDASYMNSRFEKWRKELSQQSLDELHKSFAALSQEEQKYANIFLHDVQRGDVTIEDGKTFRDYITEYQHRAKNDQIYRFAEVFGLDEELLRNMMELHLTEHNINEFGRLDELKKTVDKTKAKKYFDNLEGQPIIMPKVNIRTDKILREFILSGGFEL